jgi:acetyl-CoA C-acetyltransferase
MDLGGFAIKGALEKANVGFDKVDEVIMGQVVNAGCGQNPARQAVIKAGVAPETNALTINKVCGSGLKAVMLGTQAVQLGDADIVVAGGMESMTNAPYLLDGARYKGYRYGDGVLMDGVVKDGLWCAFNNVHMGNLAEFTAKEEGVTRDEVDKLALTSQERAAKALELGWFADETIPVKIEVPKKDPIIFDKDETPRPTTADSLAKLKPAFDKEGIVTAGNAPGLSDGASAVVVASEKAAKNYKPIAAVLDFASAHVEPKKLFWAPIYAVRKLMDKNGWKISDFDAIEANEAFAVQAFVNGKHLGWDWNKVNMAGGAIALGHPIGSSGARCLATCIGNLKRTGGKRGLVTLCLGGGGAVALAVELV